MALRSLYKCRVLLSKQLIEKKLLVTIPKQVQKYTTSTSPLLKKEEIHVTFIKPDGEKIKVKANIGDNLLDVVVNHDLDFDGYGACEGTLTCSTCHVILKQEDYDKVPDKPTEDEMDMLDLAFELTDTSRLGCQVVLTKEMDGIEVKVPATINDVRNSR
ncbi:adrenodoxin-like protein 2, mitochondrial [Chrysoperla carnea]|uniref:adrenodoxin-like protein 2, mitochondrial n=1 Tax=Chrysoperla carnea TaxID=189513 RepID=UPI001D065673|nr:adrenodoxin-like protein 2, mitochondrial [Chrysoperla carnea]